MKIWRRQKGSLVALVAACLFMLQTLAGALAASQDRVPLDAFGNPLCITGVVHADQDDDGPGHAKIPNCCILGCASLVGAVIPVLPPAFDPVVFAETDLPVALREAPPAIALTEHSPSSPRAPPVQA